jgi:DNA-binding GntR family transcriptional regulator
MSDAASGLPRIMRQSVADAAYETVRGAVVSGVFAPGEQLVESRVAEQLGVSRGTAREALRRLRDEGLATGAPNRGIFVRELTLDDVIDLYNVRVGIEGVAIRICTRLRRATTTLRALIEEMRACAGRGDLVGVSDREFTFHEELCALSGNVHLAATFHSISGLTRLAFVGEYAAYGDVTTVAAEHEPLIEAIESGDEERAVRALIAHMDIALTLRQAQAGFKWPEGAAAGEDLVAIAGVATHRSAMPGRA